MAEINLRELIIEFLQRKDLFNKDIKKIDDGDIYNEFSLQYELGIFLRDELKNKGFKVQFERNVEFFGGNKEKFVKKEIDIVVFSDKTSEKYAIELKFPPNGFYEKRMHHLVKDIQFMEEVVRPKEKGGLGFSKTYCLTLISDLANGEKFRTGEKVKPEIAQYFIDPTIARIKNEKKNVDENVPPYKEKKKTHFHKINGSYSIEWKAIGSKDYHYYLIEIPDDSKKTI